jgi:uncharacterized membrane protein (UPF0127 family)
MAARSYVKVVKRETGEVLLEKARWCGSPLCRLVGLQFRRRLKPGEALILAKRKDSIRESSIHMFFVFFPLAVAWINSRGEVTGAQLARPWRPYYAAQAPACYVLETAPEFLERVAIGDFVDFVDF